ncbi:phage tail sheath subtilisin-like domain-containing protein [Streptomyces sp. NBC_01275]|uniref:phage tail sheath family protein n=1 Tax=Streptomyces sp. NBC_01275 TaxID=2903807 RepID=UPI002255AA5B|nr:phage tail sheath subtilisin-like domain-containing protein [Streptomyces sp. NBC_01275]MCX4759758.1 phage tail sheath subtilisin-like domain-containing protein [Streptomyces sp. NBC_01275]
MLNYADKTPGVHIEEDTAAGPITGAGTGAAAFIGIVAKPPPDAQLGKPVPVTSWTAYTDAFDGHKAGLNLPHAVRGFFENGGALAHIVPVKDTAGGLATALDQLERQPGIGIVCLPGVVEPAAQKELVGHCARLRDRFAVLDGAQDSNPLKLDGVLQTQRSGLVSSDGAYAALYWPWIVVSDPLAPADKPGLLTVPPSGHVAGVIARSEDRRGVHKAPANEPLRGALDLAYALNDTEHGKLNEGGVNAVRRFAGRPPLVWGARTLSDETAWRYINVRRLVSYIEASLLQGLRWAVFEPNNTTLWKGLERSVTEFLTRVWQSGALFGRTAGEAFYVKIDEELNPPAVRESGLVVIEVGVAPTRPAEHVVVRLGLSAGGAQLSEN